MKRVTYVAGVAVAAMIAMAAMPNEAAAIPSGSFNFGPVGDVLFDGSANIPAAPTQKTYEAASVNNNGKGVFATIVIGTPVTPTPAVFNLPSSTVDQPITPFDISAGGFTFNFTDAHLVNDTIAGASFSALSEGSITAGPTNNGDTVTLSQSCDQSAPGALNCSNTVNTTAQTTPEPASMVMLGSALLGFGLFRRRRNKA